jgi:hypothetical protein
MTLARCAPIAAALFIGAPADGNAGTTVIDCSPSKTRIVMAPGGIVNDTAAAFVAVPGATTIFTQGGTAKSCVIVVFSAGVATNGLLAIRAVLDAAVVANPSIATYISQNNTEEARSRTFIFKNVAPGAHDITIQYSTNAATILGSTHLIVHYAP